MVDLDGPSVVPKQRGDDAIRQINFTLNILFICVKLTLISI